MSKNIKKNNDERGLSNFANELTRFFSDVSDSKVDYDFELEQWIVGEGWSTRIERTVDCVSLRAASDFNPRNLLLSVLRHTDELCEDVELSSDVVEILERQHAETMYDRTCNLDIVGTVRFVHPDGRAIGFGIQGELSYDIEFEKAEFAHTWYVAGTTVPAYLKKGSGTVIETV